MSKVYRNDIDGLRAIAVLSVILFHLKLTFFKGGFIGVDVFFVISGYLITKNILEQIAETNSFSLWDFYARRFKRLFPSIFFVLIVITIFWLYLGLPHESIDYFKSVKYSVLGFANFFFKKTIGGYFAGPSEEMPLLHFWSLAVEEQFYVYWSLLFYFFKKNHLRFILLSILLSFILSEYYLMSAQVNEAFFSVQSRIWQLACGGLLAHITLNKKPSFENHFWCVQIIPLASAIILGICVYAFDRLTRFPGALAILPTCLTIFIIYFNQKTSWLNILLENKCMVLIGQRSYSLYLWHYPIIAFFLINSATPHLSYVTIGFILVLTFALTEFSFHLVEKPFRYGQFWEKYTNPQIVKIFLSGMLLMLIVGVFVSKIDFFYKNKYGSEIDTKINERYRAKTNIVPGNKKLLILWGDSHAREFGYLFEKMATASDSDFLFMGKRETPPLLDLKIFFEQRVTVSKNLNIRNLENLKIIKKYKEDHPENSISVVLSARWSHYTSIQPISPFDEKIFFNAKFNQEESIQQFKTSLISTINKLMEIGVQNIFILNQLPEFPYHIGKCKLKNACQIPVEEYERQQFLVQQVFSNLENVKFIDLDRYTCDVKNCYQFYQNNLENFPMYFDDDHPSVEFNKFIFSELAPELKL
ncbi:MAG: acyltransferase [Bacteriovoracaceae bacterium]|nr:acyltransferase [Bacteriovoracaceae bacterium]